MKGEASPVPPKNLIGPSIGSKGAIVGLPRAIRRKKDERCRQATARIGQPHATKRTGRLPAFNLRRFSAGVRRNRPPDDGDFSLSPSLGSVPLFGTREAPSSPVRGFFFCLQLGGQEKTQAVQTLGSFLGVAGSSLGALFRHSLLGGRGEGSARQSRSRTRSLSRSRGRTCSVEQDAGCSRGYARSGRTISSCGTKP